MHTGKKTKIIATVGPSTESDEMIEKLIKEGVNIFRFNTKHNTNEWHRDHIDSVKKISKKLNITVGILVDLQGPEIRIETKDGKEISLNSNESIQLVSDFSNSTYEKVIKVPELLIKTLEVGDNFSIDDGFMEFKVTKRDEKFLVAEIFDSATIKTRKGLNLAGKDIAFPSLTSSDIERLTMAKEVNADFIALSFVRSQQDIDLLRIELSKINFDTNIIAKIESQKGVDNIDNILEASDGIMIGRGDLGIEIPIEQVTHIQKQLILKCRNTSKPVIVATQMLQSMIENARPTRAEAADVANAVFDETDCVMLSGETASGRYPEKAVSFMRRIIKYNESKKQHFTFVPKSHGQTHLIANAAMSILRDTHDIKIDKVLVFTETGKTAKVLSSYRPNVPVIALSDNERTVNSLTMSYGIAPILANFDAGEYSYPEKIINSLIEINVLQQDTTIMIVHGKRWKEPGGTNALVVVNL